MNFREPTFMRRAGGQWNDRCGATTALALACTSMVSVACDASLGDSGGQDSSRVEVDILFLDAAQVIGQLSGDPASLFGTIASVATDVQRRIYVGDRSGASVRAFD